LGAGKKNLDCEVFVGSFDNLQKIHNKWTFSQFASNEFAEVPDTFRIESKEQLDTFRSRSTNLVFKPVFSRFASETQIQPTSTQLDRIEPTVRKPWVAQSYISGNEFSTFSIARQGKLMAHCTYHSSFRAGVGSGICFQATSNETITKFTKQFVRQLDFTGQIGFDFIIDEGGKAWVIEGNPRATSGLHLFKPDGLLVEAILGKSDSLVEATAGSSHMVGVAMLMYGLPSSIATGRFSRFVSDLFSSKDVLFNLNDPLPFVSMPLTIGELWWKAFRNRLSLQQVTTQDIQWDGEPI
jgi:predicted ATP-grasp superfamily ATP-dependent carboligase